MIMFISKKKKKKKNWVATHGIFCKNAKKFRTFLLMNDTRSILTLTSGVKKYSQKNYFVCFFFNLTFIKKRRETS